jgi:hypothetical protein
MPGLQKSICSGAGKLLIQRSDQDEAVMRMADELVEPAVRHVEGIERIVAVKGQGYFPVLVKLADGSLGAVIRGGAPHIGRAGRLDWIRSTDGGKTWSAPTVIVDSEWDDRIPAVGVMPDGAIVVAWAEASTYNEKGEFDVEAGAYTPKFSISTDAGAAWSKPKLLEASFDNGSPYGRIIVLADGTALMSMYQFPSDATCILRSTDKGRTWGDATELPGHDETALLEKPDGNLLAFTRAEGSGTHGLDLAESTDGGRTWCEPLPHLKPHQWPFDACISPDGGILLTYGCRIGPYGVGAVLSHDGGETWRFSHRVFLAWDSESTDTGYPSTVLLDDGTIVTMYYAVGTADLPGVEQALVLRYREDQLRHD